MAKFVWIDVENGGRVPINPDQVRYLRRTVDGKTGIVFGAFAGGYDQVVSEMGAEAVVMLLESDRKPGDLAACLAAHALAGGA